jgi:hypothetical protein
MPTDSRTPNRNYPRPSTDNTIAEDLARLITALNAIDTDVANLLTSVAGRALLAHLHTIANVTGLQTVLDGKSDTTHNHSLGSLTGVNLTGASNGQLLGLVAGVVQAITLAASQIPNLDAGKITTGTIDPARLPALPSGNQVVSASATIAGLSTPNQDETVKGTIVTTTDGRRWVYSGSGSKVLEASYVELADVTPEWTAIANRPATFAPSAHPHAIADITSLQTSLDAKSNVLQAFTSIASAATTSIGGLATENTEITGTTAITSFGTATAGTVRNVRAMGVFVITHNATSLITKTGANITTAVGDTFRLISLGGTNWFMSNYDRANGTALVAPAAGAPLPITSAGVGRWQALEAVSPSGWPNPCAWVLPSGGTWAWIVTTVEFAGAQDFTMRAGVGAGGTTAHSQGTGGQTVVIRGFCWRIT